MSKNKRHQKRWTNQECIYLRNHYLDSISSLIQLLKRSESSIRHKMWRLGLIRRGKTLHPFLGKKSLRRRIFNFDKLNTSLAYLVGVYLGDGGTFHNKTGYVFQLSVIDEDFILKVIQAIKNILKYTPNYYFYKNKKNPYSNRGIYSLRVCSTDFAKWLEKITEKKQRIPKIILNTNYENTCAFLNGLMDSEASMSSCFDERYKYQKNYQLYFAITSSWIKDVQTLLSKIGVKYSPIHTKSGIPRFTINKLSFYKNNLRFSIYRKQQILEDYISLYYPNYKEVCEKEVPIN